jgi:hypothetical protein
MANKGEEFLASCIVIAMESRFTGIYIQDLIHSIELQLHIRSRHVKIGEKMHCRNIPFDVASL